LFLEAEGWMQMID